MFKELEHAECTDDSGVLTYPYHYRAHPLVIQAANFVRQHLNEHGYIVPGLGDAGDRFFGTI